MLVLVLLLTLVATCCGVPIGTGRHTIGFNNNRTFLADDLFTVPEGVYILGLELQGGGGGGGGGMITSGIAGGGGGRAGAWLRDVVTVYPGMELAITVGQGGAGGFAGTTGTDGTWSTVEISNPVLISWFPRTAGGGEAGSGALMGVGGTAALGPINTGDGSLYSDGEVGQNGALIDPDGGAGGAGGTVGIYSLRGNGLGGPAQLIPGADGNSGEAYGGGGGGGNSGAVGSSNGGDGASGYVVLSW